MNSEVKNIPFHIETINHLLLDYNKSLVEAYRDESWFRIALEDYPQYSKWIEYREKINVLNNKIYKNLDLWLLKDVQNHKVVLLNLIRKAENNVQQKLNDDWFACRNDYTKGIQNNPDDKRDLDWFFENWRQNLLGQEEEYFESLRMCYYENLFEYKSEILERELSSDHPCNFNLKRIEYFMNIFISLRAFDDAKFFGRHIARRWKFTVREFAVNQTVNWFLTPYKKRFREQSTFDNLESWFSNELGKILNEILETPASRQEPIPKKTATPYKSKYDKKRLGILYSILAENYISGVSSEEFVQALYFGKPKEKIRWEKSFVLLSFFINETFSESTNNYWEVAQEIFTDKKGNKIRNLRTDHQNAYHRKTTVKGYSTLISIINKMDST